MADFPRGRVLVFSNGGDPMVKLKHEPARDFGPV